MGKHLRYTWFTIRMMAIMFQGWIPGCVGQSGFCSTQNEIEIFKARVKAISARHFQTRSIKDITNTYYNLLG